MTDVSNENDVTDAVVDARRLSRSFGELVAVDDVSFQVQRGSIFGLLGPNGSGKSTIIRMLLGVLPPSSGEARVLGFDAARESERVKSRVGYMSQHFSLYADLSVRENIDFYGRIYGLDAEQLARRRAEVIELTSLEHQVPQLAGNLSGGWQRRLALACALIHEPDLLFLDEPTAGIDPVARRHLWDLLFELSGRGVTLFVTTHYMDEAERCNDVGYIYLSKLLVLGRPEQLKSLPSVTPEGTTRYELRVPTPAKRLSLLRNMEGVRDATLFGETIHVLAEDAVTPQRLRQRLSVAADEWSSRVIPPSLEDVFVTLTTEAEASRERGPRPAPEELALEKPAPKESAPKELAAEESAAEESAAEESAPEESAPERSSPEESSPPPRRGDPSDTASPPALAPRSEETPARPDPPKPAPYRPIRSRTFNGLRAVVVKEFFHIRRQPSTLFFMLVVPVMQTIIFGYAIETQIENIPLVVFNMDGRQKSRELISAFANTRRFRLESEVYDEGVFHRRLTSGRAKVGLRIPPYYSDRILRGEQVQVQVLIDGSDSQVATTAQSTAQLLGLNLSVQIARTAVDARQTAPARNAAGHAALPIETRTRLLYNPDLESSHFFVPGLVGIILQLVTLFLTSFAIVRERELGTLEQLFVTPVGRSGLMLGKLLPYAMVGFVELLIVMTVMIYVFGVSINGDIPLLLALSMLFMICSLGLGLLVSTLAKTQLEAMQFAFMIMLPSVLLSGFMFPRAEMPLPIYLATFAIPVTYYIEILRGIVLRGADAADLASSIFGLTVCGVVVLTLSVLRFQKRLR